MPHGADVGLEASWSVPGYAERSTVLEVEGDNGRLLASEDALELDRRRPWASTAAGTCGSRTRRPAAARASTSRRDPVPDRRVVPGVGDRGAPPVHRVDARGHDRAPRAQSLYASARAGVAGAGRAVTRVITIDAPRMLLSVRSLSGVSMATRDRRLTVMGRYEARSRSRWRCPRRWRPASHGILAALTPTAGAALAELPKPVADLRRRARAVRVRPGRARARLPGGDREGRGRAGAWQRARASVSEVFRPALFYHGNLAQRLPVLIDLERSDIPDGELRGLSARCVVHRPGARGRQPPPVQAWCRQVRRRRLAAGLETRNPATCWRASTSGASVRISSSARSSSGLLTKPTPDELLVALARTEIPWWRASLRERRRSARRRRSLPRAITARPGSPRHRRDGRHRCRAARIEETVAFGRCDARVSAAAHAIGFSAPIPVGHDTPT